jgi:hypothetical protein
MPLAFGYLASLATYVAFAGLILVIALVMAIEPATRSWARQIAGGVIASFPFVFLFQALSCPAIFAMMGFLVLLNKIFGVEGPSFEILATSAFVLAFVIFATAWLMGFITGWGVGARIASGVGVRAALRGSRVVRFLAALLRGLFPALSSVA